MEIKTPTREERIASHIKGIKMSVMPAVMGFVAGVLSGFLVGVQPKDNLIFIPFVILVGAIYAQKYASRLIGINSKDFVFKDWFYLAFLTFAYWYVTWTIVINGSVFTSFF